MPEWIIRLARRLVALPEGRYSVILTVDGKHRDWTVVDLGKVEK